MTFFYLCNISNFYFIFFSFCGRMESVVALTADEIVKEVAGLDRVQAGVDEIEGLVRPDFPRLKKKGRKRKAGDAGLASVHEDVRRVPVPPHRFSPLKAQWVELYEPLVKELKLQVRMNLKNRVVELKSSKFTEDPGALQKGSEFIRAFTLGFQVKDAVALLRLDDLFIESFEVTDVKTLKGDHLSRAIGRIAGKDGKTKFTIENATKTRVVLADSKIHILGSYQNTKLARDAICSLILGAPPGKIYNKLRTVASRLNERF